MNNSVEVKKRKYSLFHSGATDLSLEDWESIILSLISYGDTIWLNANSRFSPLIEIELRRMLDYTLRDLHSRGLIKYWMLELPDQFRDSTIQVEKLIKLDDQRELYESVYSSISRSEYQPYARSGEGAGLGAKLISFNAELWTLGIAALCDAPYICYRGSGSGIKFNKQIYHYERLQGKFVKTLFSEFKIKTAPLAFLEVNAIVSLHKHAQQLRAELNPLIEESEKGFDIPDAKVQRHCRNLYKKYLSNLADSLNDRSSQRLIEEVGKDGAIAVASLFLFPAVSLVSLLDKGVDWFRGKKKYGFAGYMNRIQSYSDKYSRYSQNPEREESRRT